MVKTELVGKNQGLCRLRFSVQDSGIGMSPEQLRRLFSAFSQADSSVTRKFGGTGLGLTISKRLVEMMGGEISVESQSGQGSTFSFTVEFKKGVVPEEARLAIPMDLTGFKVLVVDDNELARDALTGQLESFGFRVVNVGSGDAALQELARAASGRAYDLVLMDWKMPHMDGIEASKRIKQDADLGKIPLIIMVTAFGREEVMRKADKAGVNAFLMKPVSPSLLLDTIMQVLGREVSAAPRPKLVIDNHLNIKEKIAGARVLLVEDNNLNQQVAAEILESVGLIVDIANNGQEAVDAVTQTDYDLVLMDVQMPIMGGYEATRLIRADSSQAALPIIAMTAHAMSGAREECLEVGMNDYVGKPIDPTQLFAVLALWIKPGVRVGGGEVTAPIEKSGVEDVPIQLPDHLPGLDIASGLNRLNGNRRLYKQLLVDFSSKYAVVTKEIRAMMAQSDLPAAAALAHSLKGIAGNISADAIYAAARALELGLTEKRAEDYAGLLSHLDQALQPVLESVSRLAEVPEEQPMSPDLPVDPGKVGPILKELARLLEEFNPDAEKCLEALKENLGGSLLNAEIQALEGYMANFDFQNALLPLQKIADEINITLG